MAKPISGAVVTCDYDDPSGCAAGECGFHTGRDYRADIGTPVHASKAGKVVFAGAHTPAPGDDWGEAYGTQVIIDTSGIRHLYAHLSKVSVAKDQLVKAGDNVGLSGDTGNTHGPHLHYEERVHPYAHCPNNREPQFDKEPETDDMPTPEQLWGHVIAFDTKAGTMLSEARTNAILARQNTHGLAAQVAALKAALNAVAAKVDIDPGELTAITAAAQAGAAAALEAATIADQPAGLLPAMVVDLDDAGLVEIATAVADEQARRLQ
jgi:hypothetical protein